MHAQGRPWMTRSPVQGMERGPPRSICDSVPGGGGGGGMGGGGVLRGFPRRVLLLQKGGSILSIKKNYNFKCIYIIIIRSKYYFK